MTSTVQEPRPERSRRSSQVTETRSSRGSRRSGRSRLDWSELQREPHARLLRWYADLIRLRRDRPDLRDPRLDGVSVTWEDRRLRSVRGSCTVLVNLADAAWPCDVAADDVPLLAWEDVEPADGKVLVPARSAVVLGPR